LAQTVVTFYERTGTEKGLHPTLDRKEIDMNDNNSNPPKEGRKRGLTSVALQWLADKMRRTERIKEVLQRGTYQVDSSKIAEAILNGDGQPKH
jgi:anti-sigma28 factor (negative regulator of flagellin synthesis)